MRLLCFFFRCRGHTMTTLGLQEACRLLRVSPGRPQQLYPPLPYRPDASAAPTRAVEATLWGLCRTAPR